jgi:uncharacterized protein (DUF305 family)
MALRSTLLSTSLWLLGSIVASGQQAPIVQPGAPGQSSRSLSPEAARMPARPPTEADTEFMQGMIHHHSQAVEMTDLLRTRTRTPELQALGKRISISQADEIKYMKQWLEDRGKAVPMDHGHMGHMAGMNMQGMHMMDMGSMPLMPGMLSPEQMQALAKASGKKFDYLFLTGMIQHHTGALVMVEDLFNTPGAGQDNVLFDFATDIDNTQRAEIEIMRGLLKEKR